MLVVKRQQVVEEGLPCSRPGGRSNSSRKAGGRIGCKYYRGAVEGQQQHESWWRRDRRGW